MLDRDDEGRGQSFAAGLLLGLVVGAGAALLLAPEKGERLRRRMKRRLREAGDDARERIEDAAEGVRDEVRRRRKELGRAFD